MADLLRTFKTFTGNVSGTHQQQQQSIGSFGFTRQQAKQAIDSGLITTAKQSRNNAGGFTFTLDPLAQCRRFLILGDATKGTYYTTAKDVMKQNLDCFTKVINQGRASDLVNLIVDISTKGLAPNQDTIVFSLAWLSCHPIENVRKAAYNAIPKVLRTPTVQFQFIFKWRKAIRESKGEKGAGWGRGMRRAFIAYYVDTPLQKLAYQMSKYQQRDGASQRDVLRLIHPSVGGKRKRDGQQKATGEIDAERNLLFAWATNKGKLDDKITSDYLELRTAKPDSFDVLDYLMAVNEGLHTEDPEKAIHLVTNVNLVREQLNTSVLKHVSVWGALLEKMPMTALLRNLSSMTAKGVFDNNEYLGLAITSLTNEEAIQKARIHPLNVFKAIKVYDQGKGDKGSLSWVPVREIKQALDSMFRSSFKYGTPTGKKILVGLDVSGSMGYNSIPSMKMNCREASAVMSVALLHAGDPMDFVVFSHKLKPLSVRRNVWVSDFERRISNIPFGSTDCAQPMLYAIQQRKYDYDAFVIFTDNETYFGQVKPFEALAHYCIKSGRKDAKLIVCGMTSTDFTIADPSNPNTLDIVGLDSSTPQIISNFIAGKI